MVKISNAAPFNEHSEKHIGFRAGEVVRRNWNWTRRHLCKQCRTNQGKKDDEDGCTDFHGHCSTWSNKTSDRTAKISSWTEVQSLSLGTTPMSALGQKQTFALHQSMSALPPIATSIAFFGMSALGQQQTCSRVAGDWQRSGSTRTVGRSFGHKAAGELVEGGRQCRIMGRRWPHLPSNGHIVSVSRQGAIGDSESCCCASWGCSLRLHSPVPLRIRRAPNPGPPMLASARHSAP